MPGPGGRSPHRGEHLHDRQFRRIGGSPGAFPGAQLLVGDFDGDGKDDVLVFRPSDGYFGKWYSDTPRSPVFDYQPNGYTGLPYAELHVGDFDGDGMTDVLVFRPGDGLFGKWYSTMPRSGSFWDESLEAIGGAFGSFPNAQVISAPFTSTYMAPPVSPPPPPVITGFAPAHGPVGTVVTIIGENIRSVLWGPVKPQVQFDDIQAQLFEIADVALKAIVPPGAVTARITYVNSDGRAISSANFTVDRPVQLVTVPNVIGFSLQAAYNAIQQAGLSVTTSGATGFNLQVVAQNPGKGARVPMGSNVNLTLVQAVTGIQSITLTDALPSDSVYVWLYDSSTG